MQLNLRKRFLLLVCPVVIQTVVFFNSSLAELGPVFITPLSSDEMVSGQNLAGTSPFRSTILLSEQYIQNSSAGSLSELLEKVIGLNVVDSASASPSSVFVRGFDSHHILIKVDGFAVNDPTTPNNGAVLEYLNLNQIKQIRISQGTGLVSELSAFAGVIEIETKGYSRATERVVSEKEGITKEVQIQTAIGSYSHQSVAADLSLKKAQTSAFLSVGHTQNQMPSAKTDNLEQEENQSQYVQLNLLQKLNEAQQIQINFVHSVSELDYDECYAADFSQSDECQSDYEKNALAFRLLEQSNGVQNEYAYQYQDLKRALISLGETMGQYQSQSHRVSFKQKRQISDSLQLLAGYDGKRDSVSEIYLPIPEKKVVHHSVFSQLNLQINDSLFNLGLRYLDYQRADESEDQVDYHFFYQYQLNSNWALNFSQAQSTRMPTIYQLFDGYSGNLQLSPESVTYQEIGVLHKQQSSRALSHHQLQMDLRFFYSEIEDYIYYENQYQNSEDEVVSKGMHFLMDYQMSSYALSASYLHNLAYKQQNNQRQLARRPKQLLQLNISKQFKQTQVTISQRFRSETYDLDSTDTVLAGYGVTDLAFRYQLGPKYLKEATLNFRINNLMDKPYQIMDGYRNAERNYSLSLNFKI